MTATTIGDAAVARRDGVQARANRPQQRRSGESTAAPARVRAETAISLRAAGDDGGQLEFLGIASVTEHAYEMWDFFGPYTEIVSKGAFTDTLNRADLDVPLVLGHDQLRRMARTLNGSLALAEIEGGLEVRAPQLDPADVDVAYIAPKLRSGLIDEMSFSFRIDAGHWSPDYSEFRIDKVDLHRGDVAIVGYGANPATTAALRSSLDEQLRVATDEDVLRLSDAWTNEKARRAPVRTGMSRSRASLIFARD